MEDYYATLEKLNVPTTVSGRVTAELEMALPGSFVPNDTTPYGKEGYVKNMDAYGYEVIVDTKGKLLWRDAAGMERPYLILTSEQVTKEYLRYLDERHISWISCGKSKVALVRAADILANVFQVKRMGVVGGAAINTAFLDAGLLDEISILVGAGIDGRGCMASVFDYFEQNHPLTRMKLADVQKFDSDTVWLRYKMR